MSKDWSITKVNKNPWFTKNIMAVKSDCLEEELSQKTEVMQYINYWTHTKCIDFLYCSLFCILLVSFCDYDHHRWSRTLSGKNEDKDQTASMLAHGPDMQQVSTDLPTLCETCNHI